MSTKRSQKIPSERWERFLRLLRDQVLEPTEEFPTVRCWKRYALKKLIMRVVRTNSSELKASVFATAEEVIRSLLKIGWLKTIPLESLDQDAVAMYFLEMEAREGDMIDPLEVLQGYMPEGVLCYFGVLSYLELTTQIPPFFHVASMDKSPLPHEWRESSLHLVDEGSHYKNPMGQEIFRFEGAHCYKTRRNAALVPGIQLRNFGPRATLRMTTLEQALLDALIYPTQCGGQSVVFEAWERGVERWNSDRMADYLLRINKPSFDRRVGAMLEVLGFSNSSSRLYDRLMGVRKNIGSSTSEISLLNGMSYLGFNEQWKVRIP